MDTRPVGIYDSGVGGLTGLKALRRLLPGEDFVFFGDSGRMPYGPRSKEELRRIAKQDMDYLAQFHVKAILAACGTISSAARPVLESYPLPAFGVVDPALDAMARVPGDEPLCVIATAASIQSGEFTDALQKRCPGREIVGLPCPEFAPMIEAGHIRRDDPVVTGAVRRALEPIKGKAFGAILLGCTHYGIIEDAIRDYLGEDAPLLSASECAALALRDHLVQNGLVNTEGGAVRLFDSGDLTQFKAFAIPYLELGPVPVEAAPLMEL